MRGLIVACLCLVAGSAAGQDSVAIRLTDLSGVLAVVQYLDSPTLAAGLSADSLRAAATARLHGAGVPDGDAADVRTGILFVAASLTDIPGGGGVYAYRYDVSLVRTVLAGESRHQEPVWKCDGIATTVAGGLRRVYDSVDRCVARLADSWRAAHGKPR